MNVLTSIIGSLLIALGLDGYFNNGRLTHYLITPNYDIAISMMIIGALVLLSGICLCEFRHKTHSQPHKEAHL